MKKKNFAFLILFLLLNMTLCACGMQSQPDLYAERKAESEEIDFLSLKKTGELKLNYATQFSVEEYGVYAVIRIAEDGQFLLVPEDTPVPDNVPEDMVILKQPLNRTYLVSTSAMDLIQEIGALDNIRLSGTKEEGWYVEEAAEAMKEQKLLYAGKYSMPDYELILKEACNLAIENTMIYHNPETKEKLEEQGIPVLVEYSSYEEHPLGRLEWVKLYGVLFDREKQAETFYKQELAKIEPVMEQEYSGKSVAFFYVTANGAVSVRKPKDYIAKMISLSGGRYALEDILEEENALSTMNIQMEDFYAAAKDADILIYNSTIDGELNGIEDLLAKSPLFADFKAVQDGNVYCSTNNFFQKTTGIGDFMVDLGNILTDSKTDHYTYLRKLR